MSGFSLPTISPVFRDKIHHGLIGSEISLFEQVFGVQNTRQLSGSLPYVPSKYELGQLKEKTKVGLKAEAEVEDMELASMPFQIVAKYAKAGSVHVAAIDAMEENSGEDLAALTLKQAVRKTAFAMDVDGKDYLTNTTLNGVTINGTITVTAAWTDETNARPLKDLDAACDKVGNPDTIWLGLNFARLLASLPSIKARIANFNAVDGRVSFQELAGVIQRHYDFIRNVVIDNTSYNSANPMQTAVFARTFDSVAWVGNSEQMKCVENTKLRKAAIYLDERKDIVVGESVRYLTFARGEASQGCLIEGIA